MNNKGIIPLKWMDHRIHHHNNSFPAISALSSPLIQSPFHSIFIFPTTIYMLVFRPSFETPNYKVVVQGTVKTSKARRKFRHQKERKG